MDQEARVEPKRSTPAVQRGVLLCRSLAPAAPPVQLIAIEEWWAQFVGKLLRQSEEEQQSFAVNCKTNGETC